MNIFEKIPENFFSVLVSKNKNLYIDALFTIHNTFKEEMRVSKENLVARLINSLESSLDSIDFSEESLDDTPINNSSGKAHWLLGRLKATGWIDEEMEQDSFEKYITFPDYSIKFMNLLYSIMMDERPEYTSYVFSTYSALKVAKLEPDKTYEAINTASINTENLSTELIALYNSLGSYHKRLQNKHDINEVAKEHFLGYKEYSDEIIYPLVTRDSIPRYKGPIKEMLYDIISDQELLNTVSVSEVNKKKYNDKLEAEQDIVRKISRVIDKYESIDDKMYEIENKNNDYVRASVRRMNYLLSNDKEQKGKLIKILKNSKNPKVTDMMEEELNITKNEYLTSESLYIRTKKEDKTIEKSSPLEKIELSIDALRDLSKSMDNKYSKKAVEEFMELQFGEKSYISSEDISINNSKDFVLLIFAIIRGISSDKLFFTVEDLDEVIEKNKYIIPNMRFKKKIS